MASTRTAVSQASAPIPVNWDEHVLARVDGRLHVAGMKHRGAGDEDGVHAALDDLLVSLEIGETVVILHGELIGHGFLDLLLARLQFVLENFIHGHQAHALVGAHRVQGGPGSPPAAADQPDLDLVAARGVHPPG